jgi:dephospho-CoA kinase
VVSEFGPEVLTASGELDRKRLGEIVFADDDRRGALNRILHPRIAARTAERATELLSQGHRLACYEAALLVENGLADAFRPLVVVAVSRAVQLERAMQRDGLSAEEVEARLAAQLSLDAKVAQADYVIDNSGDLLATQAQAEDVLKKIRARLPEA